MFCPVFWPQSPASLCPPPNTHTQTTQLKDCGDILSPFMQLHLSLQSAHSQMCTEMCNVIIAYHQVVQSMFLEYFCTRPVNIPHGCLKFAQHLAKFEILYSTSRKMPWMHIFFCKSTICVFERYFQCAISPSKYKCRTVWYKLALLYNMLSLVLSTALTF